MSEWRDHLMVTAVKRTLISQAESIIVWHFYLLLETWVILITWRQLLVIIITKFNFRWFEIECFLRLLWIWLEGFGLLQLGLHTRLSSHIMHPKRKLEVHRRHWCWSNPIISKLLLPVAHELHQLQVRLFEPVLVDLERVGVGELVEADRVLEEVKVSWFPDWL